MARKKRDYVSIDSESESESDNNKLSDDDDFPSMFVKLLSHINIKIAIFIFILGLFLFSDIFIRNILSTINGAVNDLGYPTTNGTIIQLLFLVIGYLLIDLLVQGKYL
jgi:hypothetical protein